ncbi:MAG: hypothetical protein MJZ32_06660 [Bacteroidaceae bacterium]|nr:hypothetical protein [Bacteroidaceae bacterium]
MAGSFFIPYKGSHYQNGFLGSKVLVVGAHHYCPFECQNKAECEGTAKGSLRSFASTDRG